VQVDALQRAIEAATAIAPRHQQLTVGGARYRPPEPLRVLRKRLQALRARPSRSAADEAALGRLQVGRPRTTLPF
jgi:hypothetical protein